MVKTFILAAGNQTRWLYYMPNYTHKIKHLVPVHGIPLIRRTISQAKNPVVVTREPKIIDFVTCKVLNPVLKESVVQTLISTHEYWGEKAVILLGDVYFTADAIKKIYSCKEDYMFFGNKEEIFAIVINNGERLSQAFIDLSGVDISKMKLWHLYRFMHDIPLSKHDITESFTYIKDKTTDFDCVLQYEKWRKAYDKR